jgi:microcin C transport system substrate-binding protein
MQKRTWKSASWWAALACCGLLAGCQKKDQGGAQGGSRPAVAVNAVTVDTVGEADPIANTEAVKGGTFNTWGSGFPKSLNYWLEATSFTNEVASLQFESMVTLHSTENREVGILAAAWSISPDKKTFTFHIDPRARWSDGRPVQAGDVQFYYDVMMDPKNLTSIFRVALKRFSRPVVKDSLTLEVTAKEVHWNNFWDAAGMVAFPKHVWEKADFNQQNFDFPVVSGPYRLQEVKKERSITLQRRDDWWGRAKRYNQHKYNFDYIKYRFMEDQIKVLETFKKGDIDVYPVYTASLWAEKTRFDQQKKGWVARQRVFNKEPIGFQGFAINLRRPQFQDVRVREALSLLINRKLMNEKLMFNQYFLLNSYYPDLFPGNVNPKAPMREFDPKRARALLAEAGWTPGADGVLAKGGKTFQVVFLTHSPEQRHLNVYLEDLKAVGIQARIEQVSYSTLAKRMDNHEFDMYWAAWGGGRLRDPEPSWISTTADETATNNYPGLKDKVIDSLIQLQKTELSLDKRNAILVEIDDRLTQIIPYALLWQADHHRLLYWNKFGTPKYVLDKFNREDAIPTYWWIDAAKEKTLREAMGAGRALPETDGDVHYRE